MLKTFKGGIHPLIYVKGLKAKYYGKDLTAFLPIKKAKPPKVAVIPLLQHTGSPCECLVKAGDSVKCGQLIGKDKSFISSPVHSSVEGSVKKIEDIIHPVIGRTKAVFIETTNPAAAHIPITDRKYRPDLSAEEIKNLIHDAGIVGLGGAAFPTHVKLNSPTDKKIESIIINGAECEPYLSCDNALMLEKSSEIIKGLEVIKNITGAKDLYIAIEDNKPEAFLSMSKAALNSRYKVNVLKIKTKYPQGGEKQLIKTVLDKEVPSGGLPFDVGALVQNVGTANAIFEAVFEGKPLIERIVTVTGKIVKEPRNLSAKIGTSIREILEECGGVNGEIGKVIFGGPMMGIASYTLDMPIIKGTSGILILSKSEARQADERICIRCGKCVEVCPMGITPTTIALASANGKFDIAKEFGAMDCMECAACSYICPTKRQLLQNIKYAKLKIKEMPK